MAISRYILLILIQASSLLSFSQDLKPHFEYIGTDKGLSHNAVLCILQDTKGFMWFGTSDGLNKYDGSDFIVYRHDPENSKSISTTTTTTLFEDRKNRIWVGTANGGLSLFDQESGNFTNYKIGSSKIASIAQDQAGNLYINQAR